jgi:hypothetical protein
VAVRFAAGSFHRCAGPVAQWSEPTAHNGLVGGSSPPGPTTQSRNRGDFLKSGEYPRIGGVVCLRSLSETAHLCWAGLFASPVSGALKPVPGAAFGNDTSSGRSDGQTEHRMLARPLDWRIAQSGDADPTWQSTFNGGPHNVG